MNMIPDGVKRLMLYPIFCMHSDTIKANGGKQHSRIRMRELLRGDVYVKTIGSVKEDMGCILRIGHVRCSGHDH